MPVPDSPTVWHAVRPWTPRFTLVVREVTSVSATFVLTPAGNANASDSSKSTGKNGVDGPTLDDALHANSSNADSSSSSVMPNIVSEAFNRGLTVTVNGAQWKRVLMRMDEAHGEAVIVLFGLMPARQYDVELGIIPNENTLRSQITTGMQYSPPCISFECSFSMNITDIPRLPDPESVPELVIPDISEQSDQVLSIASSQSGSSAMAIPDLPTGLIPQRCPQVSRSKTVEYS